MTHVVWDWNGTLFDDLDATVQAVNDAFAAHGLGSCTVAEYHAAFTRPIWVAYERLLGRPLADGEWERLARAYYDSYHRLMERCELAAGARQTITALAGAGHTQSLLSMWYHDRLLAAVERYGIATAFARVDGLAAGAPGGEEKAEFLVRHLAALGVPAADVLMVGDVVDDAMAARRAGARAVLYAGGQQGRADLERSGVPVVDRLAEVITYI